MIKSSFSLAWLVWELSAHQSSGFCLDHYTHPTPSFSFSLSVWLQHFEMQLWISEQHHQSQYLLIFIERHASQRHLYSRVIKHLEDTGSDSFSRSALFSNAIIVSLAHLSSSYFFLYFNLLLPSSSARTTLDAPPNPPSPWPLSLWKQASRFACINM